MNLGSILRKHRKELKLTMKEVAEKAHISEGFLSQIENNVNTPSVDTLMNICSAMGVNAGDILNQVERQVKFVVIHRSDWAEIDVPKSGFATKRFFPPDNRTVIDTAILVINEGKSIPVRKNIRNSQELLSVLKGTVELELGDEKITLSEGDSIHYWSIPGKEMIFGKSPTSIVVWVGTI
ncbi:MAG TPA: helix-turn-helix domain-containing protein [Spirochaetota bacterium]|jgi:transcriptional regulator with XRE-family HTH domain|nr:helix-turn-helix domain-containing protein [Spirochaetota bacterium]HPV40979.1 helix-turn-helix domain-containing protein [Spirochaetota bacterium]